MKSYEQEMERIATVLAEVLCKGLGYQFEKVPKS